jgi:hypothetical protein
MNKDNAHEYLPLVQALADGKMIQHSLPNGEWANIDQVCFSQPSKDYRIKPEPRMFEVWVHKERGDIHHRIPPNWNEGNSWERITVQEVLK